MAIGRQANQPAPKQESQEAPRRPSWPPVLYHPQSWLVHGACVRCGAKENELRNIAPELKQDRYQTEEYVASVCKVCWYLIECYASEEPTTITDAFWEAPRYQPPNEELGRLPEGLPWSINQARRMEAWRATRPEAQGLRPWPNRTVLITIGPPLSHQEQPCPPTSQLPATPPTPSDSSFPPF